MTGSIEADVFERRKLFGGDRLTQAVHYRSVQLRSAGERAGSEAHADERADRFESYNGKATDRLEVEKEAGAMHHASVEDSVKKMKREHEEIAMMFEANEQSFAAALSPCEGLRKLESGLAS